MEDLSVEEVFNFLQLSELAFLTPPFLGGFSADVCEILVHIMATFHNFLDK
jgi:hypothetical protein